MKAKSDEAFRARLAGVSDAVVAVGTRVPEAASTAGLLGTERSGHGTIIREDGLIATIGYLVVDADVAWVRTASGRVIPAYVVCYDHESGIGLLKVATALDIRPMRLGDSSTLPVGARAWFRSSGTATNALATRVVARQEFVGRWEYLLEDALFTAPPHGNWAGAALLDDDGGLCGVGSLLLQMPQAKAKPHTVNMFVPIESILPHLDALVASGSRLTAARPWIGALIQDDESQLIIAGVYRDSPAEAAGLGPGDVVIAVAGRPVTDLATMYREMWRLGPAGVDVPLTIHSGTTTREVCIRSADRGGFHGSIIAH